MASFENSWDEILPKNKDVKNINKINIKRGKNISLNKIMN